MSSFIEIVSAGMKSTIQDAGRIGFQGSGFQASGCMDMRAYHDANALVNNPLDAAVIEMTVMGMTIVFHGHTYFALTGADMPAILCGREIKRYRTYEVKAGDRLEIGFSKSGRFGYLSIAGGFQVPKVMGSRSTNMKCKIGGFEGRALQAGDKIDFAEFNDFFPNLYLKEIKGPDYIDSIKEKIELRVVLGPQDSYFTQRGIYTFLNEIYSIADESDRMGYRCNGPAIEYNDSVDILSDGIVFGSIQVPANGMPMILMADRQTTGGYAKIATVVSADLPKLAQCMPGTEITFTAVSVNEALKLGHAEDKDKRRLRKKSGYTLLKN